MKKIQNIKNKIILFYPNDEEGFAWHPFGYHLFAPILWEAGYEPIIIDQRVQKNWYSLLEENLEHSIWVGFTLISGVMIKHALEVADKIKKMHKDMPLVFGGWHPTTLPKQTLKHPLVDFVVIGPGDNIVVDLTKYIKGEINKKPERTYSKGDIDLLSDGTTGFKSIKPLTKYNWRKGYELIPDMNLYRTENNVAGFLAAISCPYRKCNFCSIVSMYQYNIRNAEDVLDEISFLVNDLKFTSINFHDGLFFTTPRIVIPLIEGIKRRNLKFSWKAKSRANGLKKFSHQDLTLIKEAGCRVIPVGLESGSLRILDKIQKGTKPEDAVEFVKICKDYEIEVQSTYMSGLPGETVDDLKMTIDQIEQLRSIYADFYFSSFFFLPAPGNDAYNEFISTGGRVPNSLEEWSDVKWREPNKINKLHWLSQREQEEFMRIFNGYFKEENKAKRISWSHRCVKKIS